MKLAARNATCSSPRCLDRTIDSPFPAPARSTILALTALRLLLLVLFLAACRGENGPAPTSTPVDTSVQASPTPTPSAVSPSATFTPVPATATATPTPFPMMQGIPLSGRYPTLADFWAGRAEFVVEVADSGLPMGESDTIRMGNGEWWSYVHASDRSAGTIDRCGDPVPFPGCTVIYRSYDAGRHFQHDDPPVCQFDCNRCPCDSETDHVDQQQYPQVAFNGTTMALAYEYRGRVMLRRSTDGLTWSEPGQVPLTGIWQLWYRGCTWAERIGVHPYTLHYYDCLVGGPPGVYAEGDTLYVFVGLGRNPGAMGCYFGPIDGPVLLFRKCRHNPLFDGAGEYGPKDEIGPSTNPFFDFRTISSAEVQRVGNRYYMLYEGVRGPGPGDPGDTQFGLGLARSRTDQVDGPWEKFPGNPLLVDLPGNIGLGHADLVVAANGRTLLYTSLDGATRSRLTLVWQRVSKQP